MVTAGGGIVKARYDYLPFGDIIEQLGSRGNVSGYGDISTLTRKFTGKERDAESSLDYFLARYYSPGEGRFVSPDQFVLFQFNTIANHPAATRSLPYANVLDPQTLNTYAYVRNNPINQTDPDGHLAIASAFAKLSGALAHIAIRLGQYVRDNPARFTDPTRRSAARNENSSVSIVAPNNNVLLAGPIFQLSNLAPGPAFSRTAGNFLLDQGIGDFFGLAKELVTSSYNLVTHPMPDTIVNETKNVIESVAGFVTNKTVGLTTGIFDMLTVPEVAQAPSARR